MWMWLDQLKRDSVPYLSSKLSGSFETWSNVSVTDNKIFSNPRAMDCVGVGSSAPAQLGSLPSHFTKRHRNPGPCLAVLLHPVISFLPRFNCQKKRDQQKLISNWITNCCPNGPYLRNKFECALSTWLVSPCTLCSLYLFPPSLLLPGAPAALLEETWHRGKADGHFTILHSSQSTQVCQMEVNTHSFTQQKYYSEAEKNKIFEVETYWMPKADCHTMSHTYRDDWRFFPPSNQCILNFCKIRCQHLPALASVSVRRFRCWLSLGAGGRVRSWRSDLRVWGAGPEGANILIKTLRKINSWNNAHHSYKAYLSITHELIFSWAK